MRRFHSTDTPTTLNSQLTPGAWAALALYGSGLAALTVLDVPAALRTAVGALGAVGLLIGILHSLLRPWLALYALALSVALISKDRVLADVGLALTADRLFAGLLLVGMLLRQRRRGWRTLHLPLAAPMLGFGIVQMIGLCHSSRPVEAALQQFYGFLVGVLVLWAAADLLPEHRERLRTVRVLFWAATGIALLGLLETATGRYWSSAEVLHHRGGLLRAASTLGNPVPLGAYLAMLAPLGWFLLRGSAGGLRRMGLGLGLALLLGGLGATLSRQAFVGLAAAVVVVASARNAVGLMLGLLATAVLGVTTAPLWLEPAGSLFFDRDAMSNVTHRLYMSRVAFELIEQRPLLGVGLGSFRDLAFVVQPFGGLKSPHFGEHPVTDNSYLTLAAELGIPGLAAYLILLGAVFSRAARVYRACAPASAEEGCHLALLGSLSAYAVSSLFFDVHQWLSVSTLFFLLAGLSGPPAAKAAQEAPEELAVTAENR